MAAILPGSLRHPDLGRDAHQQGALDFGFGPFGHDHDIGAQPVDRQAQAVSAPRISRVVNSAKTATSMAHNATTPLLKAFPEIFL